MNHLKLKAKMKNSGEDMIVISSPLGPLGLQIHAGVLSQVSFLPHNTFLSVHHPNFSNVQNAFSRYFEDAQQTIDLPICAEGSVFAKKVWQIIAKIPSGETRTYGDIAKDLSSAARAVGAALRSNPCPIIVPCHRVVAQNHLGGYAGETEGHKMAIKTWLLRHEGLSL